MSLEPRYTHLYTGETVVARVGIYDISTYDGAWYANTDVCSFNVRTRSVTVRYGEWIEPTAAEWEQIDAIVALLRVP
jgi:hypothetical protein